MNKKIITLIIVIGGLFLITVIAAAVISGKSEMKPLDTPAQVKKPAVEKAVIEKPASAPSENVSPDIEKEYEPPIKGALLN